MDEPIGKTGWRLVRSKTLGVSALARAMRARGDVERVEPNYQVRLTGTPDDLVPSLWALQNTGQALSNGDRGTPGADINAVAAWDATTGTRSVIVATIDSGIATTHPDLAANVWSAPRSFSVTIGGVAVNCPAGSHGFNAIDLTCDPSDDNGHGTHVAGSIGATGGNATGIVGVNWTTSIMAIKFLDASGTGYVSDAVDAIDFAIQARQTLGANIRVLNASWNGGGYSQALADELQRASNADMLFVASAGNTGADHGVQPSYPASYGVANVVAVAATDYRDQLSAFSDYGADTVHLAAPGSLIYSTWTGAADQYATLSGTSMAAAYVSGAAALVLGRCTYSTGALRDALLRSARPLASLSNRVQGGRRLDAAGAVATCSGASTAVNSNVVIYAADVPASGRHGAWQLKSDATAAAGSALVTADAGWSSTSAPLANPVDYVDVAFDAPAAAAFHVWLRLRAAADSKWNDSVWVQFSDARVNGSPAYALNSTSGLAVNLEPCSGCGVSGWGWQDGAYWLGQAATVTFASSGTHTLRVQTREDGVAFDQIVLVAATSNTAPGQPSNDSTIVPRTFAPAPAPAGAAPYGGARASIPGAVAAARFDEGGEGVSYHDTTKGNSGGAFRQTDVDLEAASPGGFDVGWVSPGEWLQYSVQVTTAGAYAIVFQVAAPGPGGIFHLEAGGADVTGPLKVPDTGGWQTWRSVAATATLSAGPQTLRLVFDSAPSGIVGNFLTMTFTSSAPAAAAPLPGRIAAADFDRGPEGIAYHDTTAGNSGGAYRQSDVDIEPCSEGGFNVGWIDAGEWLTYAVSVASAGSYDVRLRVASPAGGALRVAFGSAASPSIAVPATGAWQSWTTVTVPVVLAAGTQQLTLQFESNGLNISWIDVAAR